VTSSHLTFIRTSPFSMVSFSGSTILDERQCHNILRESVAIRPELMLVSRLVHSSSLQTHSSEVLLCLPRTASRYTPQYKSPHLEVCSYIFRLWSLYLHQFLLSPFMLEPRSLLESVISTCFSCHLQFNRNFFSFEVQSSQAISQTRLYPPLLG
jgi:hypothetical protein